MARVSVVLPLFLAVVLSAQAGRLSYLDESDPFHVGLAFPKLTTPQWAGEPGVEAVVTLGIDDMRGNHARYEEFLRPILERLKQIDGRAPVSIFANAVTPDEPQFQTWLKEGLSIEAHTLTHPCPILAKGDFQAAFNTFHGCVDLMNQIPGNRPVAARTPCCDSINSPSPRLYAEIFNRTNASGQFLQADSSVMMLFTPGDPALPRELVLDPDGREKFRKYLPFPSFTTTIENYPYPYVIGKLCWQFPGMVPSDWEAQNIRGKNHPDTVEDWKAALDATVLKQGVFNLIFHPHGWIESEQVVQFIDYAVQKYGSKVKFLNLREAVDRINTNLLAGQPLRNSRGQDNGVRLIDLNGDGFLDVVIGNGALRQTRLWDPAARIWRTSPFPTQIVRADGAGNARETGVRFGIVRENGHVSCLVRSEETEGAWHFNGESWQEERRLLAGLEFQEEPIRTAHEGRDRGVRFRDLDGDGICELIVSNPDQNILLRWSASGQAWEAMPFALPAEVSVVDREGRDNGLRFVDLNSDGHEDLVFSNAAGWSVHLFIAKAIDWLGWERGWTFRVSHGERGAHGEVPMIVREGPHRNNGAWFHSGHLWVQNEDTAHLPDLVDRRSFTQLLASQDDPAKSPEESLASMVVRPGFQIELVASEPLIVDPVTFEWGADGKLWVVEMRDYPVGLDGQKDEPGGTIKFLEDTNGDGRYDRATVFLEKVPFPSGILPWRKGVLIAAAPEIFYAEDTNGDGRADRQVPLLRGFEPGNQQHRINGFELGLDNWIYAANGGSHGTIQSLGPLDAPERSAREPFSLRGRDLRFRPDEGLAETVTGASQFQRLRDDWGNWFGNENPTWLWHYAFPEQYLRRNPRLSFSSVRRVLANYPDSGRVFPVSKPQQRFNWPDAATQLTSAASPAPYRDDLFGPEFASSIFISEPAQNVVHREVLIPDGATFQSRRAPDEAQSEFLASTDNWFRPTLLRTGPDGALYIADMYRQIIEHPEYFPDELKNHPNLRSGEDKGRIYRIYPTGANLRPIPRLEPLRTAELARALESSNGWQRDTVQRLLVHRKDPTAVAPLRELAAASGDPRVRLQALSTLDGLDALDVGDLVNGLRDPSPPVREIALRLAEPFLRLGAIDTRPEGTELVRAMLALAAAPDSRVRFQLALTLGEWSDPRAAAALLRIATLDHASELTQAAVLSSAGPHFAGMIRASLESGTALAPARLRAELMAMAFEAGDHSLVAQALEGIAAWSKPVERMEALAAVKEIFEERGDGWMDPRTQDNPLLKRALVAIGPVREEARALVFDARAPESARLLGLRLWMEERHAPEIVPRLFQPDQPPALQRALLHLLRRGRVSNSAPLLFQGWNEYLPGLRAELLNATLSRMDWIEQLLAEVEGGRIAPAEISPAHQQALIGHRRPEIRARAQAVLAQQNRDRASVLEEYASVREFTGDAVRGAVLFREHCASCHRLKSEGFEVGPDLGSVADKPVSFLLAAILDPNQAVEPKYLNYTAVLSDGREINGMIAEETPNAIILRNAGGLEERILRSALSEVRGSGVSLMPDGLEAAIAPREMADLIRYLRTP